MPQHEAGDGHFLSSDLGEGVVFRYLPNSKWKRLSIDVFGRIPLNRETVTKFALIPRLLRRGTKKYPSMQALSSRLEMMYGAGLGTDTTKIGPEQVVRFGISLPSPAFVGHEGLNLAKAMSFVWDVATDPYLEADSFPKDRFDAEVEEHRRDILSIANDRPRYAAVRMMERIWGDDPSGPPSWGYVSDLADLRPSSVLRAWRDGFRTSPVSIYAIGEGSEELSSILERVSLPFPGGRELRQPMSPEAPSPPQSFLEMEEFLPGEQTILCQAFSIGVREGDPLLPAAAVFDGIFGGFSHSKLFMNIRERNSLAYFAYSSLNTWRGMVLTVAGVGDETRNRVADLVKEQITAIGRGEITDDEMESTRAGLVRRYRMERDSQSALVRRRLTQDIIGGVSDLDELVRRVKKVTKGDVVEIARRAIPVAVYALRGKGDGRDTSK